MTTVVKNDENPNKECAGEDRQSLSLPGVTAVDVAVDLRPRRDPRIGDRVSAAGPLERGSYGQMQIHALEFHTRHG